MIDADDQPVFPRPEATVAFDVDPPQAATTRCRIMAELAESRELIAGHHLDFPGIGYVAEDGDGFNLTNPGVVFP